ncbi:MAG: preprotein translocase subunit YajC [Myxococcales bacterium]|nr:preprotein translocase subunit YajC [Myxococcales bacterium]
MLSSSSPLLGLIAEAAAPSLLSGPLPMMFLMFAVLYFLVLRPASKAEKARRERIGGIKKGDKVKLNGGILGTVASVDGDVAMVEIAERVKVRVIKAELSDVVQEPAAGGEAAKAS